MRAILLSAAFLAGGCAVPAIHPAVAALPDLDEDLELSFFSTFDEASFRALAERAFLDPAPDARAAAHKLLGGVVSHSHPYLPNLADRRRLARRLLFPLTRHPDAEVRAGIWSLARLTYDDPSTSAAASDALARAIEDPDPDVRLASIRTGIALHAGHPGGCVVEAKRTPFTLRPHREALAARLVQEPDPRVRAELLRALAWCGPLAVLPDFVRYFTGADRRDEIAGVAGTVRWLFELPPGGLDQAGPPAQAPRAEAWSRFRAFADSLTGTLAARRNGLVLLLHQADAEQGSLQDDRDLIARAASWLESDEEELREEDLILVVRHWRVMDLERVVHDVRGAVRRTSAPEIARGLRAWLSQPR
jgi:hypothetical protein